MNTIERIVGHFLKSNEPKQLGQYATNGNVLIYVVPEKKTREVLAVKFKDLIIGNSSGLKHAHMVEVESGGYRRRWRSTGETIVQAEIGKFCPMIPFDVFSEAGLDLSKFKLIQRNAEETLTRFWIEEVYNKDTKKTTKVRKEEKRHFTGASLFRVDTEVFLFDFDRNELKNGILNPFLVKLSDKTVKTVEEAYKSLKPYEVSQAEKQGLGVKRQGEWFFIPVNQVTSKRLDKMLKETEAKRITLQAGPNRPNYAEGLQIYNGKPVPEQRQARGDEIGEAKKMAEESDFFVTGTVEHSGREHKDLNLKGWFKAVPNTAVESWTITGDID